MAKDRLAGAARSDAVGRRQDAEVNATLNRLAAHLEAHVAMDRLFGIVSERHPQ